MCEHSKADPLAWQRVGVGGAVSSLAEFQSRTLPPTSIPTWDFWFGKLKPKVII